MTGKLYDRLCALEIFPPDADDGVRIENLRIRFDITKTIRSEANTARITVYGLSDDTRNVIEGTEDRVRLFAGYEQDTGLELLFDGSITRVQHDISPPNVTTTLETGDGIDVLRNTRVNLSYDAGVPARQIIDDLSDELGVTVREILEDSDRGDDSYLGGFSFGGAAESALDRVTDRVGAQWSIQNGEIQVIGRGEALDREAVVLTPGTGLLATPEKLDNVTEALSEEQDIPGWRLRSLLNPKLEPGRIVEVESRVVEGRFVIQSVDHSGDTRGANWESVCEVIEL